MAGGGSGQLQPSIIPIFYKKTYLEKHNIDITDYAKSFCSENGKEGHIVTRHDIEWYWEGNIRAEFDTVDPSHNRLISQTKCPKFETHWMRKTATTAFLAKKLLQEQEEFWLLKPNRKEKKHIKSALILGNDTERWIIPDVSLMAIDDVFFDKVAQNIRAANAGATGCNLNDSKMFRLWGTLIQKAYDFVPKEVHIEKLKEAFSVYPPTTEAGFEEFFGPPSKKRKTAPSLMDDNFKKDQSVATQTGRRVSFGDFHVRTFDKDSALDPTIMSILKHNRETPSRAAADLLAIASSGSSTKADGGESGKRTVDPAQKKIQALEEELAGIKVTKNEVERKYQCERGMRRGAEGKVVWLQEELQKLQDLVAQLRELSTTQV